jgi:hypothetical protein
MSGCATSSGDTAEDEDEFIGQPPPPEDDPFSVRGDVRGEAVAATPKGAISEEDFEEPTPRDDLEANPDEWDEALGGDADAQDAPDEQPAGRRGDAEESVPESESADESEVVASRKPEPSASEAEKTRAAEASEQDKQPRGVRCFSCVRICPIEGDCASAKKDVICGWGTHSTRSQAARLARAECDATLDMARQMPVWSRIEGSCPPATCSE